jgi:hypothetical protein
MRTYRRMDGQTDMTKLVVAIAILRTGLKYMLCPHSAFLCFRCFSEQTTIFSLYSIKLFGFINKREWVYFAVRAEYLTSAQVLFRGVRKIAKRGY